MVQRKMTKVELNRLSDLLYKFQDVYTFEEIGLFENATIMEAKKLVDRIGGK